MFYYCFCINTLPQSVDADILQQEQSHILSTTIAYLCVLFARLSLQQDSNAILCYYTVNSEIFERVIFSRNFAYAKFRENKIFAKSENTLSLTDICKSCSSREFLT